jgi:prepilin-type N-terminal cleavage/methylation domain-containing protein
MSKFPTNRGFTLIESAVAIAILTIGLFAVIQFFPLSIEVIGNSQRTTTASNLGLSKIEELNGLAYDDLTVGVFEIKQRVSNDPNNYLYNYQRQVDIETLDSDLNPSASDLGLKEITVTVFWLSAIGNTERSIEIINLRSDF